MLWHKPGGSWLWLLEPDGGGCARLITRLRSRYASARPAIMIELVLMEIGDPFMMRKCLLGIKQRAERARGRATPPDNRTARRPGAALPQARLMQAGNTLRHVIGEHAILAWAATAATKITKGRFRS